jgi:hypothetical protein
MSILMTRLSGGGQLVMGIRVLLDVNESEGLWLGRLYQNGVVGKRHSGGSSVSYSRDT